WNVDASAPAFLADHAVNGVGILPATAYFEMALAAHRADAGPSAASLIDVSIERMLVLSPGMRIETVLRPAAGGRRPFEIFSRHESDAVWVRHAAGDIAIDRQAPRS